MAEPEAQSKGNVLLNWDFPEYVQPSRGRAWYLSFAIIFLVVIATSIWSANYTFVMIIFIAGLIYLVQMRRQPPLVPFTIYEDGIQVSNRFYRWDEFKEFVIIYRPPEVKKLFLEFKAGLRPAIDIPLETQNPLRVRAALGEYIPENVQREEEPLADQWSRMLKL